MSSSPSPEPQERRDLYEDDLTEERDPSPQQREDVSHDIKMDPDVENDEPVEK